MKWGAYIMSKGTSSKRYTGEFKQLVVKTMMRDKHSHKEAEEALPTEDL